MFGKFLLLKLAAMFVLSILTVVSPVTSLTDVDAPLSFIVPLVDTEDCVGQGVVTQELSRTTGESGGGSCYHLG